MDWETKGYEFPGWPIQNNPHGKEFDKEVRKRMISGSETLLPTIYKHKEKTGKNILEIGPFFNPLITQEHFPKQNICYWENDLYVLNWLDKTNENNIKTKPIFCDLSKIEGDSQITLKYETDQFFKYINNKDKLFDTIIISQVLNYVDYKLLLIILRNFLKKGGLIFINNVIDYGIPKFFSGKKPKSNKQIIDTLKETGYNIIEMQELDAPADVREIKNKNISGSTNKRLILVAKKE